MASGDRHHLTLRGLNDPRFGYGRVFVSLRDALAGSVNLVDDAAVCVDITTPNLVKGWCKGQYRACFTMWEATVLPEQFASHCQHFDEIIVPCQHNVEVFRPHSKKVSVVPLGVDMSVWKPGQRPKNKQVTFLAGGSHWYRKGLDKVIEAFAKWGNPDARLIVKCTPETIGGVPPVNVPNVQVYTDWLDQKQELALYRSIDCFVAGSRGEGWGLMPLQAMCMGIPTIITNTSGHREFAAYATWLVNTTPKPVLQDRFYTDGEWDEPDVDSLIAGFQHVADNLSESWKAAKTFLPEVCKFDWANSAQQLLQVLPLDLDRSVGPWEYAPETHYPVMVKRRVVARIGKHQVDLKPGIVYSVPANVRDTIREAGYLAENDGNVQG